MAHVNRSLRKDIIIFSLVMVILPFLINLAWLTWKNTQDTTEEAQRRHANKAQSLASAVESSLQQPMQYVMWLGLNPRLRNALEEYQQTKSTERISASLENFTYHLPQFVSGMALYAQNGELLANTFRGNDRAIEEAHAQAWFNGALGELAISGRFAPIFIDLKLRPRKTLTYAMALQNRDNEVVAVAMMQVDIKSLLGNSVGANDSIFMRNGEILIGNPLSSRTTYVSGESAISLPAHPSIQWVARSARPLNEILESISSTRWSLFFIMLGLAITVAIFVHIALNHLMSPLTDLVKWVRTFGLETPNDIAPVLRGPQEVQDIAAALRDMQQTVKQQGIELQDYAEHLRVVAEFAADWELWIDEQGRCQHCSPSALEITGRDASSFIENPELFWAIIDPRDMLRVKDSLEHLSEERRTIPEWRLMRPDGSIRWIEQVVRPISDNAEHDRGWRATLRDVTVRRELEMRLRHAHRVEELGRLAGGIAHDFNNLLSVIGGHAELINLSAKRGNKNVDAILKAVSSGASITRQLLILSRRQLEHGGSANLNETMQEVLDLLRPTIGPEVSITAVWDKTADLWTPCPPGDIQQVLLNLINNARDAMPSGGTIHIQMDQPDEQHIRIRVEDSGEGFDEEALEQIFEPYFTTKDEGKGTGLGLAMVQAIIERAGGTIEARNRSDGQSGAFFVMYLPRCHIEAIPQESETGIYRRQLVHNHQLLSDKHILIMEDNDDIRDLLSYFLSDQGAIVYEAIDGEQGIAQASTCEHIDLIISDIRMPKLSGPEAVAAIRQQHGPIPAVFMTGDAGRYQTDLHGVEHAALVTKPFTQAELLMTVAEIFDLRS